jgi:hypothetical protein|tara:strand:+ start:603 stop:1391 length:789 start_codon:yes stop_codon:yes gene_type:complete
MKKCILLTHLYIESEGIGRDLKIDQANFCVKHFRKNNPDSYIIVTGHGERPNELDDFCDYVDWQPEIIQSEIGYGHPVLVNRGIDHAIDMKFTHLLKMRLDGINMLPEIFEWCLNEMGDKKYLTTQATSKDRMVLCDLFNFGEIDFMKKCWNLENWYPCGDGLEPHARNFFNLCPEDNWTDALKNNCALKNIPYLKWIDFRGNNNWQYLKDKKQDMLENNLDGYLNYLWGSTEGWFVWDENFKLIGSQEFNRGTWATEENMR